MICKVSLWLNKTCLSQMNGMFGSNGAAQSRAPPPQALNSTHHPPPRAQVPQFLSPQVCHVFTLIDLYPGHSVCPHSDTVQVLTFWPGFLTHKPNCNFPVQPNHVNPSISQKHFIPTLLYFNIPALFLIPWILYPNTTDA